MPSCPLTLLEQQMDDDQQWALDNYSGLLQCYPGEYLVVRKKQVLAHGNDPEQLMRQASSQGIPKEELVLIAFPDPLAEIPH